MNSGSQLPPPPAGPMLDGDPATNSAATRMIAIVAVLGLTATAFLTFLWLGERAAKNDAIAERNAAQSAPRTQPAGSSAELEAAQTELVDLRTELEAAHLELEEAQAESSPSDTSADVAALEAQLAEERAEIERLEAENAALLASTTDESDQEPAADQPDPEPDAEPDPDPEPDVESEPAPDDAVATVRTATEIGTDLGGLYRQNVLGVGQRRCLGERALEALGDDLEVILASENPELDQRLFEVLLSSTGPCAIAVSALFG